MTSRTGNERLMVGGVLLLLIIVPWLARDCEADRWRNPIPAWLVLLTSGLMIDDRLRDRCWTRLIAFGRRVGQVHVARAFQTTS